MGAAQPNSLEARFAAMKHSTRYFIHSNVGLWLAFVGACVGVAALGLASDWIGMADPAGASEPAAGLGVLAVVLIGLGAGWHLMAAGGQPMPDDVKKVVDSIDDK